MTTRPTIHLGALANAGAVADRQSATRARRREQAQRMFQEEDDHD
jgi:hypothetical protein